MSKKENNTIQSFWVLIGSLSGFLFAIISSTILSRYFDKADYGTYKQVMYVYNTLLVIFTLGLPKAFSYFLPRVKNEEAKDLISKLNIILLALGSCMSACIFFGSNLIGDLLKNHNLVSPLKYFALVPLFLLPTLGLEGILSTYKKTFFLAIYKTSTQIFTLLCVVLPVIIFKGDINSAIIGFLIASFCSFLLALYLKYYPVRNHKKTTSNVSYREIFKYTLPIMGASIWGVIINSSDQFFISRFFGNEVFADFANGSLELPFVAMVISATSTVLSPLFSKLVYENKENVKSEVLVMWRTVMNKIVKITYPLVVFCFCFADIIMIILYGDIYANSGVYFQLKLIVNFFTIITYSPLILSIGGQNYYFKVHMYGAILLIFIQYLGIHFFESSYLVTLISVVCQIGRIFCMLFFIAKYFNIPLKDLFPVKLILKIVFPSFIVLYLLRFLIENYLNINNYLILIISFIVYLMFYYIWVSINKIDYYTIVKPLVNKFFK